MRFLLVQTSSTTNVACFMLLFVTCCFWSIVPATSSTSSSNVSSIGCHTNWMSHLHSRSCKLRIRQSLSHSNQYQSYCSTSANVVSTGLEDGWSLSDDSSSSMDEYRDDEEMKNVALMSSIKTKRTASSRSSHSSREKIGNNNTVRPLKFWENMVCGAISRSIAQTVMHPANTMKTLLQSRSASSGSANAQFGIEAGQQLTLKALARPRNVRILTRGAGAQFMLSVPHGAVNFAVLEFVRGHMGRIFENSRYVAGFGLDFLSSCVATLCCSVISTPQMMITDNIMAGTYPNLASAVEGLAKDKGVSGFYTGWFPGVAGKIPSYALTWMFFQQLKQAQLRIFNRDPYDIENSIMGCMASATTVCIMIPMDTIKTRLVTQMNYPDLVPYKGIIDAAVRISAEEGIGAFYRGLAPRLISVVPMIGIQFGVYEYMKKVMLARNASFSGVNFKGEGHKLQEFSMEVAADDEQPFPAPSCKGNPKVCEEDKKSALKGRNTNSKKKQ